MSHRSNKKNSTPVAIILPILIVLIIVFQNSQQDENKNVDEGPVTVNTDPAPQTVEGDHSANSEDVLKQIGDDRFESPAGLIYSSGSADGHRLDHLMRHAVDVPEKPVHGVFNGEQRDILLLIDEVWTMSQERGPPAVEVKKQGNRTVITAEIGRETGYVGGQSGKRKGYPKCSGVRLVVEGRNVITAYPVQ